jgi:hypothetical protein
MPSTIVRPVGGGWDATTIAADRSWAVRIGDAEVEALLEVVRSASDQPILSVGPDDVDLRTFASTAAAIRDQLWGRRGHGFVVVEGLPVGDITEAETELVYWAVGLQFGTPVTQSIAGDFMGHVRRTPGASHYRGYTSGDALGFHSDFTPMAGLLTRRTARAGGTSVLVSSATVHDRMLERDPKLVAVLYDEIAIGRLREQHEGEPSYVMQPVFAVENGMFGAFYNRAMINQAQELDAAPKLTSAQLAAIEMLEEVSNDPSLRFQHLLEVGDLLFIENNRVLHGRSDFEDHDEPDQRRHLLRLWLRPDDGVVTTPRAVRYSYRFGNTGLTPDQSLAGS